jgi:hypothetical protein
VKKERALQLHLAQMKDVIEQQAVYEAVCAGMKPLDACAAVITGSFKLSPIVAEGLVKHETYNG